MDKVVYTHRRNDTNKVFYIGMGSPKRPYDKKRSSQWNNIVNKAGYTIEVVANSLNADDALELEAFMIEEYGIETLCNHTTGGKYATFNDEAKKNMSVSRINYYKEKGDYTISQEHKDNISKGNRGKLKGRIPWNKGIKTGKLTEEHKEKLRGREPWNKGIKLNK
tara:strand:- start:784 stop:1278 length:495 start_codon:yes stop_codon:yes gene_type:complete